MWQNGVAIQCGGMVRPGIVIHQNSVAGCLKRLFTSHKRWYIRWTREEVGNWWGGRWNKKSGKIIVEMLPL